MVKVYLLLGGNLGDRKKNILSAINLIEQKIGSVSKRSSCYETAPWGFTDQPNFYNIALEVQTDLLPRQVLKENLYIEQELGRTRVPGKQWKERLIDIDILFFGDQIIQEENLKIPHPFLHERKFVLEPMKEIAGFFVHPVLNKTIEELAEDCNDNLKVIKIGDIYEVE